METQNMVEYDSFALACAVISAKWAMGLGCSQSRQILCGLGGLVFRPLASDAFAFKCSAALPGQSRRQVCSESVL